MTCQVLRKKLQELANVPQIEYINEFYEYGSEINGSGALDRFNITRCKSSSLNLRGITLFRKL